MRAGERLRQGGRVLQRLVERERTAREPGRERFALEILHDEELEAVLLADVVERADVGMVQPRDRSGLALEALSSLRLFGGVRRQDLDGHDAPHACVVRAIDLAHPSTAQEGDDLVRSQAGAGLKCQMGRPPIIWRP